MKLIDSKLLDNVSKEAKSSARLRMNYNFHESLEAKSQRLLNALEPGTLLPVHRHKHTSETFFVLRGKIRLLIYDDKGEIKDSILMDPLKGFYGAHIDAGEWHSVESLESNSVLFECKDGPYIPITDADILSLSNK